MGTMVKCYTASCNEIPACAKAQLLAISVQRKGHQGASEMPCVSWRVAWRSLSELGVGVRFAALSYL